MPTPSLQFTIFTLISLSLHYLNGVLSEEFDFRTLTLTSLKLLGDAHLNNASIRLTRDLPVPNSGSGRVLYNKPIQFREEKTHFPVSFSTFFTFSVINLNPSSVGGGLAFLITKDDKEVGDAGGSLGLKGGADSDSLSSFVGVEFDTLMDVEYDDINGNHVGVDLNSLVSSEVCDLSEVEVELKSGNLVNAWIEFDGPTKVLNVSVSYSNLQPKQPLLSVQLELDKFVDDYMYVGFSGSTQGSTEIHSIQWWSFKSSFSYSPPPPSPPPPKSFPSVVPSPPLIPFFRPNPNPSTFVSPPISPAPSESVRSPSKMDKGKSSSCHNELCKGNPGAVAGVVTAGAFFLAIFAGLLIWVFSKRFKVIKKTESLAPDIVVRSPKEFSYKDLKLATRAFDSGMIIGNGAFGTVYKGVIAETGTMVAVKRCSHSGGQGKAEFLSELSIIGTLRHRNLVRLQGWCHEKGEILLVYDFMPNGSLDKVLFESRMPLEWHHRPKILLGVASALAYLHQECENQVIHRDIKTSNIMLDEEYNARLGDFGLARQVAHDKSPEATVAAGTMGYLAPEYLLTGRATEKTDVFSFGAVVLEVASGRRPIERETSGVGRLGQCSNLVDWVWTLHREERLLEAADLRLEGEFDVGEMRRLLLVGLICSHPDPLVRPTMRVVIQMLVGEAEVPIVPRSKPSMSFSTSHLLLSLQDSVSDCNGLITLSTSSSDASFHGDELLLYALC